jgi:hypothetical protein
MRFLNRILHNVGVIIFFTTKFTKGFHKGHYGFVFVV